LQFLFGFIAEKGGHMKISNRLIVGLSAMLALMIVMTGVGLWRLEKMASSVNTIVKVDAAQERIVLEWVGETKANTVRALVLTRSEDEAIRKLLTPVMESTTKRISELQKIVEETLTTGEEKAIFAEIGEKRKKYLATRAAAVESRKAGNNDAAARIVDTEMVPAINDYVATLHKMADYQKRSMEAAGNSVILSASWGQRIFVGCALAALLLGVLFAWWLLRSITRPLAQAVQVAQTVATGDLTAQIDVKTQDETGLLIQALKEMNDNLVKTVRDVRIGIDSIATASKEIASGNAHLSQRTEQQASSLEETAASMEELTTTVNQNAENARQARDLAGSASAIAQKGGKVVADVVATMGDISDSSTKIADIISVIDGISFQTNILALNAAVEAARAGEQGRGFAVVASEVRSLAQRSATAAKEIKALIGDSAAKVENGARLVTDAGKTMDEIVDSVRRVSEIIAEITTASQEQSSGIAQVNQAITHMDGATQQNAALVEQAAATAEHMASQAEMLAAAVKWFKLSDSGSERPEDTTTYTRPRPASMGHHQGPVAGGADTRETRMPRLDREPRRALPKAGVTAGQASAKPGMPESGDGEWKEF
jgi:methyl-accepting chemotaxis protein